MNSLSGTVTARIGRRSALRGHSHKLIRTAGRGVTPVSVTLLLCFRGGAGSEVEDFCLRLWESLTGEDLRLKKFAYVVRGHSQKEIILLLHISPPWIPC